MLSCIRGHSLAFSRIERPAREVLVELYHDYILDLADIAKVYGVGYSTVHRWFQQLSIDRRSLSSAQELNWIKNPEGYDAALKRAMTASVPHTRGKSFWTPEGIRKSIATKRARSKITRVTIVCRCGCGLSREVPPSRVNANGDFLSVACRDRYYSAEARNKRKAKQAANDLPDPRTASETDSGWK